MACNSAGNAGCRTRVAWKSPFPDDDYTATCSLEAGGGDLRNLEISRRSPEAVTVTIQGNSASSATDTVNCLAMHD